MFSEDGFSSSVSSAGEAESSVLRGARMCSWPSCEGSLNACAGEVASCSGPTANGAASSEPSQLNSSSLPASNEVTSMRYSLKPDKNRRTRNSTCGSAQIVRIRASLEISKWAVPSGHLSSPAHGSELVPVNSGNAVCVGRMGWRGVYRVDESSIDETRKEKPKPKQTYTPTSCSTSWRTTDAFGSG